MLKSIYRFLFRSSTSEAAKPSGRGFEIPDSELVLFSSFYHEAVLV